MRKLVFIVMTAIALVAAQTPVASKADVSVSVGIGVQIGQPPPPIPVYVQPPVPAPGYIWVPGYWAWGPAGYYWVPGTWVLPPAPGLLWTPGYWVYDDGFYTWDPGYWAASVGFYGNVDYGFGYFGVGYVGGYWDGDDFRYNTAVTNVNTTIVRNTYIDRTVIVNKNITRVSYDGGPGGIVARPSVHDFFVARFDRHDPPTAAQIEHQKIAAQDRNYLASVNHGRPPFAAVDHPLSKLSLPPHFVAIRSRDLLAARRHPAGRTALSRNRLPATRHVAASGHARIAAGRRTAMRHTLAARRVTSHRPLVGYHRNTLRFGRQHPHQVAQRGPRPLSRLHPYALGHPYSIAHPQVARYEQRGVQSRVVHQGMLPARPNHQGRPHGVPGGGGGRRGSQRRAGG
jgi:hypothetical protein